MKTGASAPVFIYYCELAIADVHRHFKAKTHFSCLRFGPHDEILLKIILLGSFYYRALHGVSGL